ncbi:MAG: tol-pal system protein YbgF [Myxococcales bacterium]|nr:tol-pal system protein YbgF [Myxococcales bacterium]
MKRCVPSIVALLLVAVGCSNVTKSDLSKLRRQVDELAQKDSASQRRIEELNNRLFLLEDKVDTTRVAQQRKGKRAPRLPVIRIKPTATANAGDADSNDADSDDGNNSGGSNADDSPVGGKTLVASHRVRLVGAARRSKGPRPVLKLHGQSVARGRSYRSIHLDGPDPQSVREKLPVVPLPSAAKRRAARRHAARASSGAANAYAVAMKRYRAGRYAQAASAFRGFLGNYAKHTYADNALYWLGECLYDMKKYKMALQMFRRVVEQYPSGNKAPDALLKMGFCYMKLSQKGNARSVLAQVVEIFPKTRVARLASATLAKL